ncbi:MAG: MauE/DoxX family redox-associated membrane protein [Bacteroidota bacterium]
MQKIFRYLLSFFFIVAGIWHFVDPSFYYELIPDYLPYPQTLNVLSGFLEVLFGFGILFSTVRKWAATGILLLLIAFIPSHIFFLQIGSCLENGLCVAPWVAWVRLLIIHPLFLLWAWYVGFGLKRKS